MYADYDYYCDSFAGTLVPAEDFITLSAKAERYLDYITVHKIKAVTKAVKNAVCVAVEALYEMQRSYENIPAGIKSENTDGYSVTYNDYDFSAVRKQQEETMLDAFVQELSGTGLLYQGVS